MSLTNNSYDISPYALERNSSKLPGIDLQRAALMDASLALNEDTLPIGFPIYQFEEQQRRYRHYWDWFTGEILNETKGETPNGEKIYKFPLKINPVRNFSRKHAALLFGEIPEHSHRPLVKALLTPISLDPEPPEPITPDTPATPSPDSSPELAVPEPPQPNPEKLEGKFYANIVNLVLKQSGGDALMMENGVISQFLGGSFLTLNYVPWRNDLLIPIEVRNPKPDFVIPIWSNDDPWDLLEAYIVYRMPSKTAELQYGIKTSENPWVTFVEHWTKRHHSIYIDGKPLVATYLSRTISYNKQPNIFGFVPVYYLPRLRETGYWGSGLVPDIEGLALELNGRMADTGSAVMRTIHRKALGRNIQSAPRPKKMGNGEEYTDLGMENPSAKHPPDIWYEDPPQWSESLTNFSDKIWEQLLREGSLTPVSFGEDEGSQRSAMTLAIRFWPTVVLAKAQRIFWTQGLSKMAAGILRMCQILNLEIEGKKVKEDFQRRFEIGMDWLPMVARDREQTVNEVVLLSSTTPSRMSLERSLELLGDVTDIEEEIGRIWQDAQQQAAYQQQQMQAEVDIQSPVATDGLDEE